MDDKIYIFIAYRYNRLKYKINKLGEFWRMYLTWCKVFDEQSDKLFNERYN